MAAAGHPAPLACAGAVLAGGAGRRIGGDKAGYALAGRPLLHHVLGNLRRVARPVSVVVRADTVLPALPEGPEPAVWTEPEGGPQHPLSGIVHALERAGGQPVLVCAVDLPLLDPDTLRVLLVAAALAPDAPVVAAQADGHLQVLCALYRPSALAGLQGFDAGTRTIDAVTALGPAIVPFEDPTPFLNVNRPEDADRAAGLLAARERRR